MSSFNRCKELVKASDQLCVEDRLLIVVLSVGECGFDGMSGMESAGREKRGVRGDGSVSGAEIVIVCCVAGGVDVR